MGFLFPLSPWGEPGLFSSSLPMGNHSGKAGSAPELGDPGRLSRLAQPVPVLTKSPDLRLRVLGWNEVAGMPLS